MGILTSDEITAYADAIRSAKLLNALAALRRLSNDERLEIMDQFCPHCGTDNMPCHCWNDE